MPGFYCLAENNVRTFPGPQMYFPGPCRSPQRNMKTNSSYRDSWICRTEYPGLETDGVEHEQTYALWSTPRKWIQGVMLPWPSVSVQLLRWSTEVAAMSTRAMNSFIVKSKKWTNALFEMLRGVLQFIRLLLFYSVIFPSVRHFSVLKIPVTPATYST